MAQSPYLHLLYKLEYWDDQNILVEVEIRGETSWQATFGNFRRVSGLAILEYPEVEDLLTPIRPCGLRLDLQAENGEDFEILWTNEDRQFMVMLFIDQVEYFRGFIKPDGIYQDWTSDTYDISIDCVGGLGFLEDLSYVDASTGLNFSGLRKPIEIISDCLQRTGVEMDIRTLPNVVYTGLSETVDILDNSRLKVDRFIRADEDTTMSCKEVLEEVLKIFGLIIFQERGDWWVLDPELLLSKDLEIYFNYDYLGAQKTVYTTKVKKFRTVGSHINSYFFYHINANQRLETRNSISGVRVNYKYGLDEALIDNEFLEHNGTTYSGWTINDATRHDYGDNNAGAKIDHDDSVVVMTADAIAVTADDLVKIGWKACNLSTPAATRTFAFRVRIGTSHYLNASSGEWKTSTYTNYTEILTGFSTSIEPKQVDPVPATGSLIVEIMGFEFVTTTQGHILLEKFSISPGTGGNALPVEGENHTTQIPGGSVAKDPVEVANGDNPSAVYYGTIYKDDALTPTETWTRIGQSESKALLRILSEKIVRINQKPSRYFSGDVYNLDEFMNIVDIHNITADFLVMGYSYNTKTRIGSMILKQIYNTELTGETYELTLDYGNTVKPTIIG